MYDVDKYVSGHMEDTHAHTDTSMAEASKYGHTMLLTQHKPPQPRTSSLGLICVPMLTCGEAKGSAKSCPATDPGDRKQSFGVQSGYRAAIRQGWSAECAQQRA